MNSSLPVEGEIGPEWGDKMQRVAWKLNGVVSVQLISAVNMGLRKHTHATPELYCEFACGPAEHTEHPLHQQLLERLRAGGAKTSSAEPPTQRWVFAGAK